MALHRLMLDTANHLGVEIHDLDYDYASDDSSRTNQQLGKHKLLHLISALEIDNEEGDVSQEPTQTKIEDINVSEAALRSEPFWQPSLSAMQIEKKQRRMTRQKEKRRSGDSRDSGRQRSTVVICWMNSKQ